MNQIENQVVRTLEPWEPNNFHATKNWGLDKKTEKNILVYDLGGGAMSQPRIWWAVDRVDHVDPINELNGIMGNG